MLERAVGRAALCALAITSLMACGEMGDDTGSTSAEASVCTDIGTSWWNQAFAPKTGTFHVDFSATPSANNLDAVIGISNGPASTWSQLAAIVRFNPQGYIDARAGGVYTSVATYRYDANITYYFRVTIDVATRTYSVGVGYRPGFFTSTIAQDYPFRTEQASVTQLSNVASFVETPGTLQLCGFNVDATTTTGGDCIASTAGGSFKNIGVTPSVGGLAITLQAMPSQANMDGVIGVAGKSVTAYNDMAASIRFWTNGRIEARDGDIYRADVDVPYIAGSTYQATFVIDIPTKTYSVYLFNYAAGWTDAIKLATGYHFRPQQQALSRIDHVSTVVASPSGRVDVCGATNRSPSALQYLREGNFHVVTLAGDVALLSDAARTVRVDADGVTLASYAVGGKLAVDRDGNIYAAREAGGSITIEAYTPDFALRWSRVAETAGPVIGIAASLYGDVLVAVPGQIIRFGTDGSARSWWSVPGALAISVSASGYAAYLGNNRFEMYEGNGTRRWVWTFNGSADVTAITLAPDGSLAFGGEYFGTIDFGDGELTPHNSSENGPSNAYMVILSAQGVLQWSRHLDGDTVNALAFNGSRSVAAVYDFTQFPWNTMYVFDWWGPLLRNWSEEGFGLGDNGNVGEVAISVSGRVWANLEAMPYWTTERTSWPYLVTLPTQ